MEWVSKCERASRATILKLQSVLGRSADEQARARRSWVSQCLLVSHPHFTPPPPHPLVVPPSCLRPPPSYTLSIQRPRPDTKNRSKQLQYILSVLATWWYDGIDKLGQEVKCLVWILMVSGLNLMYIA